MGQKEVEEGREFDRRMSEAFAAAEKSNPRNDPELKPWVRVMPRGALKVGRNHPPEVDPERMVPSKIGFDSFDEDDSGDPGIESARRKRWLRENVEDPRKL